MREKKKKNLEKCYKALHVVKDKYIYTGRWVP